MYILVENEDTILSRGNKRGECITNCMKIRVSVVNKEDIRIIIIYYGEHLNLELMRKEICHGLPIPTELNVMAKDIANKLNYKLYKVELINW